MAFVERRGITDIESRLVWLELTAELHQKELTSLKDSGEKVQLVLTHINGTLAQIKWLAVGALSVLVFQSLGLDEALKLFLHVVVP